MTRNEQRINSLDERLQPLARAFLAKCADEGLAVVITSGRRTIAEQNTLYAQGRTAAGRIVTNARGGQSPHNFGLAFDVVPLRNGQPDWSAIGSVWDHLGTIGKELGLAWGGDFHSIKDLPHFEWPEWRQIQAAWRRGDINVA